MDLCCDSLPMEEALAGQPGCVWLLQGDDAALLREQVMRQAVPEEGG